MAVKPASGEVYNYAYGLANALTLLSRSQKIGNVDRNSSADSSIT